MCFELGFKTKSLYLIELGAAYGWPPPFALSDTFGFCLFCGGRDITTHRVAVIVRLGLGLGLGLALGQVRVMVRVRVSSVPPRREHSGVPPCSKCTPLPAAYPLPRSRSAIGYIETPVDGTLTSQDEEPPEAPGSLQAPRQRIDLTTPTRPSGNGKGKLYFGG